MPRADTTGPVSERGTLIVAGLILAGLAVVLLGQVLVEEAGATAPVAGAADRPGHERPGEAHVGAWVVPPGREQVAMRLLRPVIARGVSGRAVTAVQIRGAEVRVTLEGGGALLLRGRGWISPVAEVAFEGVAEDAAVRARLEGRAVGELFDRVAPRTGGAPDTRRAVGRVRAAPDPGSGILTPASRATGLSAVVLLCLALVLGGLASALSGALQPHRPALERAPRPSRWLLAGGLVAVGLRVALSVISRAETDEVRPLTNGLATIANTHDAWLHPPLYRALGRAWVELIGWRAGDPVWELRAPSVVAAAAGVVFLALAVTRLSRARSGGLFALCAVLVGPAFVSATVLARPYGVSSLFGGIVAYCVSDPARGGGRTGVALAAVGLALWTDVLSGALLALFVLGWLARAPEGRWRALGLAGFTLALFAAPLAPGAIVAALDPAPIAGLSEAVLRSQRPEFGLGQGAPLSLALELGALSVAGVPVGWLGAPAVLFGAGVAVLASRRRPDLALAFAGALVLVGALGLSRSVRPRNLVLLPMFFSMLWGSAVSATLRRGSLRT